MSLLPFATPCNSFLSKPFSDVGVYALSFDNYPPVIIYPEENFYTVTSFWFGIEENPSGTGGTQRIYIMVREHNTPGSFPETIAEVLRSGGDNIVRLEFGVNIGNNTSLKILVSIPEERINFETAPEVGGWNLVTFVLKKEGSTSSVECIVNGAIEEDYTIEERTFSIDPTGQILFFWHDDATSVQVRKASNVIYMRYNLPEATTIPNSLRIRQEKLLNGRSPKYYGQFGEVILNAFEDPLEYSDDLRLLNAPVIYDHSVGGESSYFSNGPIRDSSGPQADQCDSFLKTNYSIDEGQIFPADENLKFTEEEYEAFLTNIRDEAARRSQKEKV